MVQLKEFINGLLKSCFSVAGKLIFAIIVLIVGSLIIKKIKSTMRKHTPAKHMDPTVQCFLTNLVGICLNILLAVTLIAIMGVPMASVVAVIASAGVAIGLALQGSLSNLAGGVMLLIFHPFKLDHYIECSGGISGTVKDIGLFYTVLQTPDNKSITIPNGTLMNDKVINYSLHDTRRVDFTFSVAYGSDVERVTSVLLDEAKKHYLVLESPAPFCRLAKQNASSLDFVLRVWVNSGDYWTVNFDILEAVNKRFAAEGIEIPFNQLDINIKK